MVAKVETTPFDAADYLNSAEDVAAYLDVWLEDGTPQELRAALETVARSRGMSDLARATGISRAGLYKALGPDGNPSFDTVRAVLGSLGLRLAVVSAKEQAEAA